MVVGASITQLERCERMRAVRGEDIVGGVMVVVSQGREGDMRLYCWGRERERERVVTAGRRGETYLIDILCRSSI